MTNNPLTEFQENTGSKKRIPAFHSAITIFCITMLLLLLITPVVSATDILDSVNFQDTGNWPALTSTVRFDRITVEDGLSQNAVLTILQDQKGFMWFGTEDGLNKFDGYQFSIYKNDPEDPTTIIDNLVSKLYEDKNGNLWIGTRSGLDRYDRVSGEFTHYQDDPDVPNSLSGTWVVTLHEDRDGFLWLGTDDGGLNQLDPQTGTFTHYLHDPNDPGSLSSDSVRVILEDQKGNLWVGTRDGLNRFDRATGTFTRYHHDPNDSQSLSDNNITALLEDQQGRIWVGTDAGGLNRLDPSNASFIHYNNDPADSDSLSHDRIRALYEDEFGRLWVGTQNGLDYFHSAKDRFLHFRHDPSDPYSLSSNSIWSIYQDRTGVLWFGTYGGGISKYSKAANRFNLYQHQSNNPNSLTDNMVWTILEDQNGIVWIGTFNGGLNKLDRSTGTYSVFQHDPNDPGSISSDDIRTILEDRKGHLWIGTSGGLDRFDPSTETFIHYRHDPNDPDSLSENRVIVLLEDVSGNLWVGTRTQGLNKMDSDTGTFTHFQHDPDDPDSLSDNRVWSLHEDREGAIWVGTLGGLNRLDEAEDRFTRYNHDPDNPQGLSNDSVFSIYEDPASGIWIGTWGGGLDRFNRENQTFTNFTEKDGLPNNVIYGIESDDEGRLWMSTNVGLSRFDPQTESFKNYDVSDGLQNNEFNVGAHFRSQSGELFFGGIQGFNAFFPEQVTESSHIPPIVITSFAKFNQPVEADLGEGDHIELSYKENFISFEFAALDYNSPQKNQYAYMLEGFDQDWIEAGTRRYASYTNLSGGDYVFRVKGSNSDGIWNEEGVSVRITVTPPIWETWWFLGSAVIVLAGALFTWYRLRVKSIETRSRELEFLVDERTEEIEHRTQELETLYRADEELYRSLHLDKVLKTLVDLAMDMLKADKSSLLIWDENNEKLVVHTSRGFSPKTLKIMSYAAGEGVIGIVATSVEPVVVEDTQQDPRVDQQVMEIEGIRSSMYFPIEISGKVFGVFSADYIQPRAFGEDEQRLFTALAQRAASAIQNAQLYEQAQELAVVEERSRLARDLHDAVTQTLFSSSLIAEVLPRIWERDSEEGRRRLDELRELTRGALAEMRTLLLELRPAALDEADLGELLRQLSESITGRTRVPVQLEVTGDCDPTSDIKIAFYRIAQEALNNVAKHAGASKVTVNLQCKSGKLELQIMDDGQGFKTEDVTAESLGLGIMRERAEAINAQLNIVSRPGVGTKIVTIWTEQSDSMNDET